jgi:hypothetical protein
MVSEKTGVMGAAFPWIREHRTDAPFLGLVGECALWVGPGLALGRMDAELGKFAFDGCEVRHRTLPELLFGPGGAFCTVSAVRRWAATVRCS